MKKVLVIHPDDRSTGEVRYVINDSHAELLKTKETYSMWCHSDAFFERHDMKGFHSGMIISEEMERIILERYNANDPVTWFNRRNIVIL